jgi:hypothetical protein
MKTTKAAGLVVAAGLLFAQAVSVRAAPAPAGRYSIAGPVGLQTVTDTKTKLVWERAFTASSTMEDAKKHCAALGATLGGAGWRLPTFKELLTLVSYAGDFGLALTDLQAFPGTPPAAFWSSTPDLNLPPFVHMVDFASGEAGGEGPGGTGALRCVR